ncbi:MAG: OmpA family protein [Muribaculaceae bacterium]|nr:OmpA family protein [Muribaculaceae bacterium]
MKKEFYIVFAILATVCITLTGCGGAKLSVADEQMARGEYHDAANTYRKVYNKMTKREERPTRGMIAFKMGECYRKINMSARASAAYQNAIRYAYPDSMKFLYLAQSQHKEGKYAAALKNYDAFLELNPKSQEAKDGKRGCQLALKWKKTPTRYIVKNAKLLNSRRADFAPMFLPGGDYDQLYFTSSSEKATGTNKSEITGTKKSDIFVSKKNEKGAWQRPELAEGELNTELDEGITAFSPDGTTMYLAKARREPNANTSVEIYTSQRSEAQWSAPQKLEITADTISAYGDPAISADGNWLYFVSDMPGGQGGKDIWRINLKERIGTLENLGDVINTPGDERFPYWRSDSVMYFSSDGHAGLGGLDLFRAQLTPSGGWNIVNMGIPMNSAADDFGITFDKGESGFFSSNRNDARGYDHIYSFVLPDLQIWISGSVLDKDEEPVPNAIIRIVGDDGSNQKAMGKPDGTFRFKLQRGVKYAMLASAKNYLNGKQEFESDTIEEDAEYTVDFILASIEKPQVVENIFYDFDKAVLRDESKQALDEMAQLLKDNPHVAIEMSSHTDRIGSDEYNNKLSDRRAKSVVDYLISQGIAEDRLRHKGYGKSRPKTVTKRIARLYPQFKEGDTLTEEYIDGLSDEDKDAADQINRRTEFQVISTNYIY